VQDKPQNMVPHPVIYFDGFCKLCNYSVSVVKKYDRRRIFRYAHLSSNYAQIHLKQTPKKNQIPDSVILQLDDRLLSQSEAVFAILEYLDPPIKWLRIFRIFPTFLLNGVYRIIAKTRYRIFGRNRQCPVPDASERYLFLD